MVYEPFISAVRRVWRERIPNAVVVLVIAFGVGLNAAMFVVLRADVLHPLNYHEPDRLVFVTEEGPMGAGDSLPTFRDWRDENNAFDSMALYKTAQEELYEVNKRRIVTVVEVSPKFFSVLRVSPVLGRDFRSSDIPSHAPHVALVSMRFWKREYGSNHNILGAILRINDQDLRVVGVIDPGRLFNRVDVLIPIAINDPTWPRSDRSAEVIARLKARLTPDEAEANMAAIEARLERSYPESNTDWHVFVELAQEEVVHGARRTAYLLFLASALVLFLASLNVSGLLLARAVERSREFALRMVMGSSRIRVFQELFYETVLLCFVGGVVGVVFCAWGWKFLTAVLPAEIGKPSLDSWNLAVVGFAGVTILCASLIVGFASAWRLCRQDLAPLLHESALPLLRLRKPRLRGLIVIVEIGAAIALTICTALVTESFVNVRHVDLGFNPHNLFVITTSLSGQEDDAAVANSGDLWHRLKGMGEFAAVAAVSNFPLSGATTHYMASLPSNPTKRWDTIYCRVTPSYFEAMGIPVRAGRTFPDSDTKSNIVIVSQLAAQEFWPDQNPIGQHLVVDGTQTVIGVVSDVRWLAAGIGYQPLKPEIYALANQVSELLSPTIVVRTRGNFQDAFGALEAFHGSTQFDVSAGDEILSQIAAPQEGYSLLMCTFTIFAIVVSFVGIYALFSHSVTSRTHEISMRIVLGAQPRAILAMVIREGLITAFIGVSIGLVGAVGLTRFLRGMLYGVGPENVATYAVVGTLFLCLAFACVFSQAQRASRIAPKEMLRR